MQYSVFSVKRFPSSVFRQVFSVKCFPSSVFRQVFSVKCFCIVFLHGVSSHGFQFASHGEDLASKIAHDMQSKGPHANDMNVYQQG